MNKRYSAAFSWKKAAEEHVFQAPTFIQNEDGNSSRPMWEIPLRHQPPA